MITGRLSPLLALLAALAPAAPAFAADSPRGALSIAAAANLVYALKPLDAEFARAEPGIRLTTATGASGNLVAQIRNGAPYDVFLSADLEFPRALVSSGHADGRSLTTFAVGRLVVWTTRNDIDVSDVSAVVRNPRVVKLAIANTRSAPYGRAAQEAMVHLGVWDAAQPKLVIGENISQTAEFVETGNADAGFVAMSLVLSPRLRDKGHWAEVPGSLYAPLDQGAVITLHGAGNPAARAYIDFLRGAAAARVFRDYGYGLPAAR